MAEIRTFSIPLYSFPPSQVGCESAALAVVEAAAAAVATAVATAVEATFPTLAISEDWGVSDILDASLSGSRVCEDRVFRACKLDRGTKRG